MRKVVIVGPPPVQVLDVTGPLEVFSNAPDYEIQLANPGPETTFGNVKADVLADKDPDFNRGNFCSVIRNSSWRG